MYQRVTNPAHLALIIPIQSSMCLRVREAYGASPLRKCAITHRWFESIRKRSNSHKDSNSSNNSVDG